MKKYGASEMDIKQVVARCLKNAPDRKDGGGRVSKDNGRSTWTSKISH